MRGLVLSEELAMNQREVIRSHSEVLFERARSSPHWEPLMIAGRALRFASEASSEIEMQKALRRAERAVNILRAIESDIVVRRY